MVKLVENAASYVDEEVYRYINFEFKQLRKYEQHLEEISRAEELSRTSERFTRKMTAPEINMRKDMHWKMENLYKAFDDAVEIAPADRREQLRNRVRARLVYNETPLFFEREDKLLEECVMRARLLGLAYLQPQIRHKIIDE